MYNPQKQALDFEMGAFGDRIKKGLKKVGKGLDKFTYYTITKPHMMIGKAIGGKKGEAIGRKIGGFTSKVTKLGIGAGAAGAVAPLLASPTALTALTAKRLMRKKRLKLGAKLRAKFAGKKGGVPIRLGLKRLKKRAPCKADNALAAKVAAELVAKLGGPLNAANKALKLADLQRTATYEHRKLMSDANFRKKVIAGLSTMAAAGDIGCQRTIRVLVGRP